MATRGKYGTTDVAERVEREEHRSILSKRAAFPIEDDVGQVDQEDQKEGTRPRI